MSNAKNRDPETAKLIAVSRESAFPSSEGAGVNKREHFAAMAMQALITAKPDIAPAEAAEKAVAYAEELLRKAGPVKASV